MKQFSYTVHNTMGIHATPASMINRVSQDFSSEINLSCNGRTANCKRLFSVLGLGVRAGQNVTVSVEGTDETSACAVMQSLFEKNL